MAVKIRLQRHGKKGKPYFHIVVADARVSRDGKFIDRLGAYNPNTNPATIELDSDKALQWLSNGAQPTDTARAILSYKGVLYRRHLQKGVLKGALTQEQADERFEKWLQEKEGKIEAKRSKLSQDKDSVRKAQLEAEAEVNAKRKEALDAARREAEAAAQPAEAPAEEATETPAEETPAAEAPAADASEETPAAE